MQKSIIIGSDHAGFDLKSKMVDLLKSEGFEVKDVGTHSSDSTDYPEFAHAVAAAVDDESYPLGVLICGSANGVCMTANKHQNVRAGIAWEVELAELTRQHNNANVLCLPARFISEELAGNILRAFINTPFEGGRHDRRVNKIALC
jgi:ribose 5-phosphate isomerase B